MGPQGPPGGGPPGGEFSPEAAQQLVAALGQGVG
jgi:hypothetical protein